MSLYGTSVKLGGVPCGLVRRGPVNGRYQAVFEREYAGLDEIEAIDWARPQIEGACALPAGYGFSVADIRYSAAERSYTVEVQVEDQYLGDVAGYAAQVAELTGTAAEKERIIEEQAGTIRSQAETIQALEEQAGGAVVGQLAAAYAEGVESNG